MTPTHSTEKPTPSNAAIERQVRYLMEAGARLSEVKIRTQNAKHFVGRRDPGHTADELNHVINEANRLLVHLAAWDYYVIPSAKPKKTK